MKIYVCINHSLDEHVLKKKLNWYLLLIESSRKGIPYNKSNPIKKVHVSTSWQDDGLGPCHLTHSEPVRETEIPACGPPQDIVDTAEKETFATIETIKYDLPHHLFKNLWGNNGLLLRECSRGLSEQPFKIALEPALQSVVIRFLLRGTTRNCSFKIIINSEIGATVKKMYLCYN